MREHQNINNRPLRTRTAALYIKYCIAGKEPTSKNTLIEYREYTIKYIYYSGVLSFKVAINLKFYRDNKEDDLEGPNWLG